MNLLINLCICITTILVINKSWNERKWKQATTKGNIRVGRQILCKYICLGQHWFRRGKPDQHGRTLYCRICDQIEKEDKMPKAIMKYFLITFWASMFCLIYTAFKCSQWLER